MGMAAPTNYPHQLDSKEAASQSSIIHNAQNWLEKCENYFIFWLGDSKLEKDMLGPMTQDLYVNVGKISDDSDNESNEADEAKDQSGKKKAELKKQFKKSRNKNDHGRVEEDETEHTMSTEEKIEKRKDGSTSSNDEESDDGDDKQITIIDGLNLQRALALLIECFLNIRVGDIVLAKKLIPRCTNYINFLIPLNDSLKDFVPGFDFLKSCLEIDLGVKENSNDVCKKVCSPAFGLIDEMLDKSKAIIFAAKWMFLELFKNRKHDSLDALKNVAILDDSDWMWKYVLCMRLRFLRRELGGASTKPDEQEIQASVAAMEMSKKFGGTRHAMGRAGLNQTISEVLRWRLLNKCPNVPISFGELMFDSNATIIKYLKKEARNALSRFPNICFAEFMRYSEIFSTALPSEHRNYEIAILCMTFCLRIMPTNSKANHKMGVLYLVGDEDLKEAIPFFRKAVQFGANNFPAWMDLIQSLLQSPLENDEELETIFETIFDKSWTKNQVVSLIFLQGCYLFMKGEMNKAIGIWLSMYNSNHEYDQHKQGQFSNLSKIRNRYHWPSTSVKLTEVQAAVHERLQSAGDNEMTNEGLNALKDEIASALQTTRDRFNTNARNVQGFSDNWRQSHVNRSDSAEWQRSNRNTTVNVDVSNSAKPYDNRATNGNYSNRGGNDNCRYFALQRGGTSSKDN